MSRGSPAYRMAISSCASPRSGVETLNLSIPALNDRRIRCVWSDATTDMRFNALMKAALSTVTILSLSFGMT